MKSKNAEPVPQVKSAFRDRIKRLDHVQAKELIANPHNWRTHGEHQSAAMKGILNEVGWVDALLVREDEEGRYQIIDGHLRATQDPDGMVPILVLDVTEAEATKILLTFDPIGAMAGVNTVELNTLVEDVDFESATLRKLLDDMLLNAPESDIIGGGSGSDESMSGTVAESEMELKAEEHYDYVLVMADNVNDWNRLVSLLNLPHVISDRTHRRIGMARAVAARKVLELIDGK
jgi:hypothetical protein